MFRTRGSVSASGTFRGLADQVVLGYTPGPLRLSAAEVPARLALTLAGYVPLELTLQRWPDPTLKPVRLQAKVPVLVPLLYSVKEWPGAWGLGLGALWLLLGRRRRQDSEQRQALAEQRIRRGELQPGDRVGAHTIDRLLGRGGMGSVYRTREGAALKLLRSEGRFLREVETYSRLRHPNLVFLLDWGEVHGQVYLALEFIEGKTLAQLGAVEPEQARRWAADILEGLQELERLGIVHRDVKPDNIMVDNGRARLLDFGIAAQAGAEGEAVGTAGYSAPEQLRGQPVDARADLYGLGAVLFWMLTGRPPFEGSAAQVVARQATSSPTPPDGELGRLAALLLAPRPEQRPSSAEVARVLCSTEREPPRCGPESGTGPA